MTTKDILSDLKDFLNKQIILWNSSTEYRDEYFTEGRWIFEHCLLYINKLQKDKTNQNNTTEFYLNQIKDDIMKRKWTYRTYFKNYWGRIMIGERRGRGAFKACNIVLSKINYMLYIMQLNKQ